MKRYKELLKAALSSRRIRGLVLRSTILAVFVAFVPGLAWAATTVSVFNGGLYSQPPVSSSVVASSHCQVVNNVQTIATGGGATITTGPDGVMASNSQALTGTGPGSISGTFAPSGTSGAQYWLAIDGTGGMTDTLVGAGITPTVLCVTPGSMTTTIITATVNGPTQSAKPATATVTCGGSFPTLLSGGGLVNIPEDGVKVLASYPYLSTNTHTPALDFPSGNGGSADSWAAVGWTNAKNPPPTTTTTAFAVCAAHPLGTVSVASATPNLLTGTSQSDSAITTVQCPAMTNAIGGGFSIDGQVNKYDGTQKVISDPNVGDHAVGSYPVGSGGQPKLIGTNPSGWGARGHQGGVVAGSSYVHPFAMCST